MNLNAKKIRNKRRAIIESLENDFKSSSTSEINKEIKELYKKKDNKYIEMCFVSTNYLENTFI